MKRINKIYIGSLMALGLVSCSAEAPFQEVSNEGTGRFLTSSFDVEVKNQAPTTRVLANGIPEAKDFKVEFYNPANMNSPVKSFDSYGSMPEIVELTAGDYVVKVSYFKGYGESGNNAAFKAPRYEGQSESFNVVADKIVDNIGTITCTLSNIRVKVQFGETLLAAMGSDSKVSVHVGESGNSLEFTKTTTDDGYFEYATGSTTLAANFTGTVEGEKVNVTKNIADIKPGYYYIVTFNLQTTDAADPGNIVPDKDGDFTIDASVTVKDLTTDESYNTDANPNLDQDQYLEDDMRPENGDKPGNDDQPGTGDQPGTDNPGTDDPNGDNNQDPSQGGDNNNPGGDIPELKNGPVISASEGVDLNAVNDVANLTSCALYIHCDNGIKEFTVVIDSPDLIDSLNDMAGWTDGELNLINPGSKEGFLIQLLGAENVGENVIGRTEQVFDITQFLEMLSVFDGIHKFVVNVTDSKGLSANATLQLEIK